MKKAFGIAELVITLIIIIIVCFVYLKPSNIQKIQQDNKQIQTQQQMAEEKINEINNIRTQQLQQEQKLLDEENR